MTNMFDLTKIRTRLAASLEEATGLHVVAHDVDRPNPPEISVLAGSPWVQTSEMPTYGQPWDLYLQLIVTVPRGKQTEIIEGLEMAVSLILSALAYAGEWTIDNVSQPYTLAGETYQLPAVTVKIHGPIRN